MGFSEPKERPHANDDCGDDDDNRYLNFKVLGKACCRGMGIFAEHKPMCFVCFSFRKDNFTKKKIKQEEQKDQKREKRALNRSKRNEDKVFKILV